MNEKENGKYKRPQRQRLTRSMPEQTQNRPRTEPEQTQNRTRTEQNRTCFIPFCLVLFCFVLFCFVFCFVLTSGKRETERKKENKDE